MPEGDQNLWLEFANLISELAGDPDRSDPEPAVFHGDLSPTLEDQGK
jgi:hypothetical protein